MATKLYKYNEVNVLLETFRSRFDRKTSELHNSLYSYNHYVKPESKDPKTKNSLNYLFRVYLEKYKEHQEKDFYQKMVYQRRYCNDPLSFDETIKQFRFFGNDDWPMVLTGSFFFYINFNNKKVKFALFFIVLCNFS